MFSSILIVLYMALTVGFYIHVYPPYNSSLASSEEYYREKFGVYWRHLLVSSNRAAFVFFLAFFFLAIINDVSYSLNWPYVKLFIQTEVSK